MTGLFCTGRYLPSMAVFFIASSIARRAQCPCCGQAQPRPVGCRQLSCKRCPIAWGAVPCPKQRGIGPTRAGKQSMTCVKCQGKPPPISARSEPDGASVEIAAAGVNMVAQLAARVAAVRPAVAFRARPQQRSGRRSVRVNAKVRNGGVGGGVHALCQSQQWWQHPGSPATTFGAATVVLGHNAAW